jgi:hypothetical protein
MRILNAQSAKTLFTIRRQTNSSQKKKRHRSKKIK